MFKIKTKKINPEKSNKMIWAVAIGLFLLLLSFLIFRPGEPATQRERIEGAIGYLRRAPGIIDLRIETAPDRVLIIYDSNTAGDFELISRYAAMRLAKKTPACVLELARNLPGRVVYRVTLAAGVIAHEERIQN